MPGGIVDIDKIEDIKIIYLSAVGVSTKDKEKMLENDKILDFIEKLFDEEKLIAYLKEKVGG